MTSFKNNKFIAQLRWLQQINHSEMARKDELISCFFCVQNWIFWNFKVTYAKVDNTRWSQSSIHIHFSIASFSQNFIFPGLSSSIILHFVSPVILCFINYKSQPHQLNYLIPDPKTDEEIINTINKNYDPIIHQNSKHSVTHTYTQRKSITMKNGTVDPINFIQGSIM